MLHTYLLLACSFELDLFSMSSPNRCFADKGLKRAISSGIDFRRALDLTELEEFASTKLQC
jgi:hypothetical protein